MASPTSAASATASVVTVDVDDVHLWLVGPLQVGGSLHGVAIHWALRTHSLLFVPQQLGHISVEVWALQCPEL